jgi:hypothetical protein
MGECLASRTHTHLCFDIPNELYPLDVLGLLLHNHFHTVLTRLSNFGAHGNTADKELSRIALQNCLAQEKPSPATWSTSILGILSIDMAQNHLAHFP